jgi:hypothetical protein
MKYAGDMKCAGAYWRIILKWMITKVPRRELDSTDSG